MNCPHHVSWIIPVRLGLHQCIQCWEVVTRKDISPKFEDLPAEFQRRWEAHEKEGPPAPAAAPAAPKTAAGAAPTSSKPATQPAPSPAPAPKPTAETAPSSAPAQEPAAAGSVVGS